MNTCAKYFPSLSALKNSKFLYSIHMIRSLYNPSLLDKPSGTSVLKILENEIPFINQQSFNSIKWLSITVKHK